MEFDIDMFKLLITTEEKVNGLYKDQERAGKRLSDLEHKVSMAEGMTEGADLKEMISELRKDTSRNTQRIGEGFVFVDMFTELRARLVDSGVLSKEDEKSFDKMEFHLHGGEGGTGGSGTSIGRDANVDGDLAGGDMKKDG